MRLHHFVDFLLNDLYLCIWLITLCIIITVFFNGIMQLLIVMMMTMMTANKCLFPYNGTYPQFGEEHDSFSSSDWRLIASSDCVTL